jgi:hypothetical protein
MRILAYLTFLYPVVRITFRWKNRGGVVAKALRYKLEGRGFETR